MGRPSPIDLVLHRRRQREPWSSPPPLMERAGRDSRRAGIYGLLIAAGPRPAVAPPLPIPPSASPPSRLLPLPSLRSRSTRPATPSWSARVTRLVRYSGKRPVWSTVRLTYNRRRQPQLTGERRQPTSVTHLWLPRTSAMNTEQCGQRTASKHIMCFASV